MNKKIVITISFLILVILFVSVIAGTIFYYNTALNNKDSEITSLNNEIANLTNQVSNLTSEVKNLTSANLVSILNVTEEPNNSDLVQMFPNLPVTSIPYNSLWINGSITNTGHVTAYNAGLNVTAYASDGTLEINMTIPLVINAVYGTDKATDALILNNPSLTDGNDVGVVHFGQIGSLQLGSLAVGKTGNVFLAIYHEGVVTNWTATPVWTNTP
jgi:cell division protein FtsB